MLKIHRSAWGLVLVSAALQVVIFPLPGVYWLAWIAVAPLLVAILRARSPETLQMDGQRRLLPAGALQGFLLGYVCGILWFAGTCYWIFDTMHRYGGLPVPVAALTQLLFCMYVGLYHGLFGLLLAVVARPSIKSGARSGDLGATIRQALVAAPFLWVGVELARTRITAFPWELLGYSQTANFALTRVATLAGVYGLSFELVLVNSVFAAAWFAPKGRRKWLLGAALAAAIVLQAGQFLAPPAVASDHTALLVQPNIPIESGVPWTNEYFQRTLRELTTLSLNPPGAPPALRAAGQSVEQPVGSSPAASNDAFIRSYDLIVWPESPSPFYSNDPAFRDAVSALAKQSHTWVVAGSIGIDSAKIAGGSSGSRIFNSASLVNPEGGWVGRYDKNHLVPFGEYLPFPQIFAFAGGLTKEVGEFQHGHSRAPLNAAGERFGTFICYESIFPDEVRIGPNEGAQVLLNLSNDGWYGDSGAWAQHLQQTEMRAIENDRWLLSDTNTGMTASVDPYGRIADSTQRKVRTALAAPYALTEGTTFYTRHGDWFAYLCGIISVGALLVTLVLRRR